MITVKQVINAPAWAPEPGINKVNPWFVRQGETTLFPCRGANSTMCAIGDPINVAGKYFLKGLTAGAVKG
jgi:hypothetical protein